MSKSFWSKYLARYDATGSLVCVGLDPQIDKLPPSVMGAANPIAEFNRRIIDATKEYACAYKPNLAFYLADGIRGLKALYETVAHIPEEIPILLDCKVGDIGTTMAGYVTGFFTDLKVDAITVNPLMGTDVLKPLLAIEHSFAFALALTSNPSAQDFFHGMAMHRAIADWIKHYPVERLGAVVGATQTAELELMRSLMPGRIFLVPGIGAQGGDLSSVLRYAIDTLESPKILINSSRGIIFASSKDDFAEAAALAAKELCEACR